MDDRLNTTNQEPMSEECSKTPTKSTHSDDSSDSSQDSHSSKGSNETPKTPLTPKTRGRGNSSLNTSLTPNDRLSSAKSRTPSQKELKQREKAEKQAERERQRREREEKRAAAELEKANRKAQREAEKAKREAEREVERERKEAERAKREADRREREAERERKEAERRAREAEREAERREREAERERREAERRAREAERAREEEERNRRLAKQRAILLDFVVQKKPEASTSAANKQADADDSRFMQFQLKRDQRQAPLHRIESEDLRREKRQNVEDLIREWRREASIANLASKIGLKMFGQPNYLHELRSKQHRPLSSPATWPVEMPDGGGVQLQNMVPHRFAHGDPGDGGTVWIRAKLMQFHDNFRPAYYGSWRRRTFAFGPRKPFGQDRFQINYDADSDEEWEEEEPGENISRSDDDQDEEEEEEEVDDEDASFLVPHGYLSDDEGIQEDDGAPAATDAAPVGEVDDETAKMKRLRQRISLAEYEAAYQRSSRRLRPLLLGPVWSRDSLAGLKGTPDTAETSLGEIVYEKENTSPGGVATEGQKKKAEVASDEPSESEMLLMRKALSKYTVYLWPETEVPVVPVTDVSEESPATSVKTPTTERVKKRFPPECLPYLIRLVHKNGLGKPKLQFELRTFWMLHMASRRAADAEAKGDPAPSPPKCCTVFRDYQERANSGSDVALPFTKSMVEAKIQEVAVFEHCLWRVRPDVLRAHEEELLNLPGLPPVPRDPSSVQSIADEADFCFPAWPYVTDIATTAGAAASSRRATLQSAALPAQTPSPPPPPPPPPQPTKVKKRSTLDSFFANLPAAKKSRTSGGEGDK